MNNQLLYVF